MKLFTKSSESNAKLGVAERTAYMMGNVGTALMNTIVASFVMFYYTDVMLLNPAIIGSLMLVSRFFDGVTDLAMGVIVDRTHSRFGKGRAWVLRACIPYAVCGILMMSVPTNSSELFQYIYVFITYNLCNTVCLTALYVPYNSMTCTLTSDPYERGVLGTFVMFGAVIGTMAVQSTVVVATKALGNDPGAWQKVAVVYALIGACLHLLCFAMTKERNISDDGTLENTKKSNLKEEIKAVLSNKYWLMAVGATFLALTFTNMLGGSGMYFAKGVLGDTDYYAAFANVMAITQLVGMFFAFIPMKLFGKRNTLMIGLGLMALGCFIQFLFPTILTAIIICSAIKGIGGALGGAVLYGLIADTIDYGEWKTGYCAAGIGMAAMTFVTKVSGGIAGSVIGLLMDVGKYDATLPSQPQSAIFVITLCFTIIPMVCAILAMVILIFYKLDKLYPTIQKKLAERREKKIME